MFKKLIIALSVVSLPLSLTTLTPANAAGSSKSVSIVFQGALTGNNAQIGNDQLLGVKTALEVYNSTNPRVKVKLITQDDQCDPAQASQIAQSVAQNTEVVAVVGPICSGTARASFPAYKAGKMPLICTACAVPGLTDPSDAGNGLPVFHRMVLTDAYQGPAIVEWAIDTNPKFKGGLEKGVTPKIFVADDSTPYGKSLSSIISTYITSKNYSNVGSDSIPSKAVDFSSTVAKVLDSGANVVIFGGYYSDSGHFVKALRQGGYTGVYAASAGSVIPAFITEAGAENAEGARMTLQEYPFENVASKKEMDAFLKVSGGVSPVGKQYVSEAYNATSIFLQLISSGSTTRASILDRIGRSQYKGLGGMRLRFDPYGDIVGGSPFSRWTVENGKLKYLAVSKEKPVVKKPVVKK